MPRTKRPKKVVKEEYADENEQKLKKNKSAVQYQASVEEWNSAHNKLLEKYNDAIKAITLRYNVYRLKISTKDGNAPPRDPVRHSTVFEALPDVLSSSLMEVEQRQVRTLQVARTKRTTRSSSNNRSEEDDRPMNMPPSSAMARFRTPNCHMATGGQRYNVITPKVMPNVPLSIVRRPQEGEMAFALSGSPLLVSNAGNTDTPNVIVPLMDGRVMSILPQSGLRKSDMPAVDDDTMRQLMRLRDNLDIFFKK